MTKIHRSGFFVSADGGVVRYLIDGEVTKQIAVPPGKVAVGEYIDMCSPGETMEYTGSLAVWFPSPRVGIQPYGEGSHDSGANPDYQPTSASRFEREMRVMVGRLQADNSRLAARQRALDAVERIPAAPAPAPAPAEEEKLVE